MFYVEISEAAASLEHLVVMSSRGEEIVRTRSGRPVARIVPCKTPVFHRKGGQRKGHVKMADDFDKLPERLLKGFTGETD